MRAGLVQALESQIDELQSMLGRFDHAKFLYRLGQSNQETLRGGLDASDFTSPVRMVEFLSECICKTPSTSATDCDDLAWRRVVAVVEDVFRCYTLAHFPPADAETPFDREKMRSQGEVTFPIFMEFLSTGFLASTQQRIARVRRLFGAFSNELKAAGAEEIEVLLAGIDELTEEYREHTDDSIEEMNRLERELARLWTAPPPLQRLGPLERSRALHAALALWDLRFARLKRIEVLKAQLFTVSEKGVAGASPGRTWIEDHLVLARSLTTNRPYPSDVPDVRRKPLIRLAHGRLALTHPGELYVALELALESIISASTARDRFLRARDRSIEREVARLLRDFVKSDARTQVFEGVCETPNGQHEHDLVVRHGEVFLILEVKASGRRPPLRDPDRAFRRIMDDFSADEGPAGAYRQALRLASQLRKQDGCTLFSERGEVLIRTEKPADRVSILCITDHTWRAAGANCSAFLGSDAADPLPVMIPFEDLEVLLHGFQQLGLHFDVLERFVHERALLGGFLHGSDELESAALFLANGSFDFMHKIRADKRLDHSMLAPTLSNVFDMLYEGRVSEARAWLENLRESPDFSDASALAARAIRAGSTVPTGSTNPWRDAGPDEPCPCRSGLPFGKCHQPVFNQYLTSTE